MKKNITTVLLFSATIISSSCSVFKTRKPASERDTILSQIYAEVNNADSLIGKNSEACKAKFESLYSKLYNIAGSSPYFDTADLNSLDTDIQNSFETRIALKDSFAHFDLQNSLDHECL